jgi:cellulose synthase/poly-beta-1,6-N-acetylglucosamine synthase-like glycosyltransferase
MSSQEYIIIGIEYLIFGYIAISGLYIFVFSDAENFYKKRRTPVKKNQNKIGVLIPGYKEDAVIVEAAKSALEQNHPSNQFDVIVIADLFKADTINELNTRPINLIEVFFEKTTNSIAFR